jgi:peroxiredoxin Q/BCP
MSDKPTPTYPQPGSAAPDFRLPSSTGGEVGLSDFSGKTLVLYFYPKADTPGCTTQACGFRDATADYEAAGVSVVGVSPDPLKPVEKFATKRDLAFPLLADEDHAVCEAYGVWQEKSMYGKTYMGAARTTFLIDGSGTVRKVFEKVKPAGHEAEVLAAAKEL